MTNWSSWREVRPGQFHCLIKQCAYPDCEEWFIGKPQSRYCSTHKITRANQIKRDWDKSRRSRTTGPISRFSEEEINEMRDMFLKHNVPYIAEYFGCSRKTVYKYQAKTPKNLRRV